MQIEAKLMKELAACRECDVCRTLMEDSACLVFNEMFRLFDKESETREKITSEELQNLVELCNFCEICPCCNIRAAILEAKTEFKERYGLNYKIRILENVERLGKLCGSHPGFSNLFLQNRATGGLIKMVAGIHAERKIPQFPKHGFQVWAEQQRLDKKSETKDRRKVAYFVGCTGKYLFPDIPKAAVEVLQRNGIEVYLPEQRCCGMPSLLEGDRRFTLELAQSNVQRLAEVVEDGYDIVCSCPTCGYMLKCLIREGAVYSEDYKTSQANGAEVNMTEYFLSIPPDQRAVGWVRQFAFSYVSRLFKDDQYFTSISGLKRMMVSDNVYDLGEYLRNLHLNGDLNTEFGQLNAKTAYYPPCHLREQNIGRPYIDLLSLIPGISVEPIRDTFHCCGSAGIMGFKSDFHRHSVKIGSKLKAKIRQLDPERLLTDCLSCRMQFNQITTYAVYHPIEIIKESYDALLNMEQRESVMAPYRREKMSDSKPQDNPLELEFSRTFEAAPEFVFNALSQPDLIKQWFGPHGYTCPVVEVDLKVGGNFHIEMKSPKGDIIKLNGVYKVVNPPNELEYTWQWEEPDAKETLVKVQLRSSEIGTEVVVEQGEFANEDSKQGHQQGWSDSFDRLANVIHAKQS